MKNTYFSSENRADAIIMNLTSGITTSKRTSVISSFILMQLLMLLCFFMLMNPLKAQLPFEESFRNSTAEGFFFGGNPNPAFLTAGTAIDTEGNGVLRLTSNANNQTGFVYSSGIALPSAGLEIEFEYFTYGGNGADGIAFFLFDAEADPFQIGGFGGSLGYAQRSGNLPGVSKAYLGIGLDEYGNFSNPTENRQGGPGERPQSVTLRGAGNGHAATPNNYPYLTHVQVSQAPFNFTIDVSGNSRITNPSNPGYRKVVIRLKPNDAGGFFIDLDIITGGTPTVTHNILTDFPYTQIPPEAFRLGFSSSTGGSNNYHEIRDLRITAFDTSSLTPPTAYNITAATCTNQTVDINLVNNVNAHGTALNFINLNSLDLNPATDENVHTLVIPGEGSYVYNRNRQNLVFLPADGFQGTSTTQFTVMDAFGLESNMATITVNVSDDLCMDCYSSDGMNNIFGRVFNDLNANGNLDTGEPGLADISLQLYHDLNNNGIIDMADPLVATEQSQTDGSFIFSLTPHTDARNVRDEFSNNNASGNNGSHNWKANWSRTNVTFAGNQLRLKSSNSQASRRADLTGATHAELTIDYVGVGSNPDISVEISRNTGSGDTYFQLLNINNNVAGILQIDITDYISNNTTLRIRALSGGDNDGANINFVDISYKVPKVGNYILKLNEPLPAGYFQSSTPALLPVSLFEAGDAVCNVLIGVAISQPDIKLSQNLVSINSETTQTTYCVESDEVLLEIRVKNEGNVAIDEINFSTPDTGSEPVYVSGDDNGNGILNRNETWVYHLTHLVTQENLDSESFVNNVSVSGSDAYGTEAADTNQFTVQKNNTSPVWNQDMPGDVTVSCDNVPVAPETVNATDFCNNPLEVIFSEQITEGSCTGNYLITRTWTTTDQAGNQTIHTQIITIEDTTAPVWSQTMPTDITVECNAIPEIPTDIAATDNCDTDVQISFNEAVTAGTCENAYTLTRTWTATDNCNNAIVHTQTITVQDN
ncbi:MAG: hypothetical protein EA361_06315, partial [Bacteroidetes bacterium]